MGKRIVFFLFLIVSGIFQQGYAQQSGFDKSVFYKVMQDGSIGAIDNQLKIIETSSELKQNSREAYAGALQMKSADLLRGASKKLSVFKEGNKKLERAIKIENDNADWRFLRLIIQEHAPGILGYKANIKTDAEFIHRSFINLSPDLQAAVLDYRKHSNTLQALNF